MTDDDVLFECDFSVDELAVLADLLEIPALPGVDPDMEVPDEAKGAAARGLLARGVVVADGAKGTVEITQPYSTLISTVLFADSAQVRQSMVEFIGRGLVVQVSPTAAITRWRATRSFESAAPVAAATRRDGIVEMNDSAD